MLRAANMALLCLTIVLVYGVGTDSVFMHVLTPVVVASYLWPLLQRRRTARS